MMKGDIQHGLIGAAIGGLGGALAGGAIGSIKFPSNFKTFCFSYSSVLYLNKKVLVFIVIKYIN